MFNAFLNDLLGMVLLMMFLMIPLMIFGSSTSCIVKKDNLDVIHAFLATNELVLLEFEKHTRSIGSWLLC